MRTDGFPEGLIRTGMGGWSYDPWKETFYPAQLSPRDHLSYASRQVTSIEVNSTFYRLPQRHVLLRWREETPADFVFAAKGSRSATHRKNLAEAAESVTRCVQGLAVLAPKLGPINWQLPPTKRFAPDEVTAFLSLLPEEVAGTPLRHAMEVRHESFQCRQFLELVRSRNVAIVFADSDAYPSFSDVTADFVYGRLMRSVASEPTGYAPMALRAWCARAHAWARGSEPSDLPKIDPRPPILQPRDVFLFFIAGAKERAPLAARQLIEHLRSETPA